MSWRMANSLGATATAGLLGEINASAPNRNKASDGGIGDPAHSARTSDHNPCDCHDVVCARDFTHDPAGGFDSYAFADWLARRVVSLEPRVKYIISNKRICSGQGQSYPAGVWRPYTGSNPHTKHAHVSVRHGPSLFDHAGSWGWSADVPPAPEPPPSTLTPPATAPPRVFPAPPPTYPLPAGHWYGPESSDSRNHSGFHVADRPWVRYLVQTLENRGWLYVDDADTFTPPFREQVQSFQRFAGIEDDGLIGQETFTALHQYVPSTPAPERPAD